METDNNPPQHPAQRPSQPGMTPRPVNLAARRPMIDGFAPRRPGAPMAAPVQLSRPATQIPVSGDPTAPRPVPQPPQPAQPSPAPAQPGRTAFMTSPRETSPMPQQQPPQAQDPIDTPPAGKSKLPKEPNPTGHSGLVGLIVFVLLTALLLSPFVPGKIMQDFPLSSLSFSTGDQALDCLGTQGQIQSATAYNSKAGAPIVYTYATSTTQSATCGGKAQSAVTGHTSQFNPLGLLTDVTAALVAAIIVARIWRLLFGAKRQKR